MGCAQSCGLLLSTPVLLCHDGDLAIDVHLQLHVSLFQATEHAPEHMDTQMQRFTLPQVGRTWYQQSMSSANVKAER